MAMRLLQKSAVNKAKAIDRQREIDEGAKLAKRVDSLRELSAREEKNLTDFRDKSMITLRAELEPIYAEKRALIEEVKNLATERKLLLEPIDAMWADVTKAQKICDDWDAELTVREDSMAKREDKILLQKATLEKRAASVSGKEALVQEIVETATQMLADAREVLAQARNDAQSIKMQSEMATASLVDRENAVAIRERDVQSGKEINAKVRKANIEKQIQLADLEATLERELKRKK